MRDTVMLHRSLQDGFGPFMPDDFVKHVRWGLSSL
jgi:hypothetical protein